MRQINRRKSNKSKKIQSKKKKNACLGETQENWVIPSNGQTLTFNTIFKGVHAELLSRVQFFATLWAIARQAPLSVGFSRQAYWSGLPLPPPRGLPWDWTCVDVLGSPASPTLTGDFFNTGKERAAWGTQDDQKPHLNSLFSWRQKRMLRVGESFLGGDQETHSKQR